MLADMPSSGVFNELEAPAGDIVVKPNIAESKTDRLLFVMLPHVPEFSPAAINSNFVLLAYELGIFYSLWP